MTPEEEAYLDTIAGQVHSVCALLTSMIETHPDPKALKEVFEKFGMAAFAKTNSEVVPEQLLEAMCLQNDAFSKALEVAVKRREILNKP